MTDIVVNASSGDIDVFLDTEGVTVTMETVGLNELVTVQADAAAADASAAAAATSETNAAASAAAASTSETNAATSETNAAASATAASTSETNAATSETNAAASAAAASTSETNAAASATAAATSEGNAANSETLANEWATQTSAEVVVGQGYGAKYYADQAATYASALGSFANAPAYTLVGNNTGASAPAVSLTIADVSTMLGLGPFATGTDASNLTGTVASPRLSGAYTGITGLGTLTGLTSNGVITGLDGGSYGGIFGQAGGAVGIGFDNTNGRALIQAGADSSISAVADLYLNGYGGVVVIPSSTASSSTTTGALVVGGGVGVGGDINTSGLLTLTTANPRIRLTDTLGANTWRLQANVVNTGDVGFYNENAGVTPFFIDASGTARIITGTASSSTTTGALVVTGGVGVGGVIYSSDGTVHSSDIRIKPDFSLLTGALELAAMIDVGTYTLHGGEIVGGELVLGERKHKTIGVPAQQVRRAFPDCDGLVVGNEAEQLIGLHEDKIGILALAAVKELAVEVAELKKKIHQGEIQCP